MRKIKFEDFSIDVKEKINSASIAGLYEAAGEIESQVKRNTRVDTGQLKSSWTYNVDESKCEAVVGSPLENAIWEEFGTGEYAVNGDGRKGGWTYQDAKGEWHHTKGKTPNRTLERSFNEKKNTLISIIENHLKNL